MRQSCSSHNTIKKLTFYNVFFPSLSEWDGKTLSFLPTLFSYPVFKGTPPGHKDFLLKRRLSEVRSDLEHLNILPAVTLTIRSKGSLLTP